MEENQKLNDVTIDIDLKEGVDLVQEGKKIEAGLRLINKSARTGTTKGKSYFEVGRIIREGIPGLDANPEEARKYFDAAMEHFEHSAQDSLDQREMGDYYNYGLGTKPVDKNKALSYYDSSAEKGDEISAQRAAEIRAQLAKGTATTNPVLTPETEAVENAEGTIVNENAPVEITDEDVKKVVDEDQLLIKAIRVLNDSESTKQEKEDAVELVKAATEEGSMRATVLTAYLFEGDNELVPEDVNKAKEFYEKAIEKGSSTAMYRLGILYTDEEVPFANVKKGRELILQAAHAGNAWALAYLGDCFRVKVDDKRNLEVAYRYYALAGERGLGLAYHFMAEIDASRQQLDLAQDHERLAIEFGYDPELGYQDPAFYGLSI